MTKHQSKSLKKIFIANRGEIARRIVMTANSLGIKAVALREPPRAQRFLTEAGVELVDAIDAEKNVYLDGPQLIALAKKAGCDSVHPGFGFLSENAAFAAAVIEAGLIWIGPSPQAIDAMASKDTARKTATAHGVPVTPGIDAFDMRAPEFNLLELKKKIEAIQYPVLLKAALGGGGKGMRVVERSEDLEVALQRCTSEALSSFADPHLIVEKYIGAPRHVEVQVFGDKTGQVFALGDRDCSAQRRHQKIIEEAPAPFLNDITRRAMHEAAIKLGKAVNYDSAGTVEFLVDGTAKPEQEILQPFYFLEMNTRLQVEHPVTEETLDIDLVRAQIKVALGESLPKEWQHLKPRGHSIEVRIYAEDCAAGFLPSPGPLFHFRPYLGHGVRWEMGVDDPDYISDRYDPMIAKCIGHAEDRASACRVVADALLKTVIAGPKNNLRFCATILASSDFQERITTTHHIKEWSAGIEAKINAENAEFAKDLAALPQDQFFATSANAEDKNQSLQSLSQNIFSSAVATTSEMQSDDLRRLSFTRFKKQSKGVSEVLVKSITLPGQCQPLDIILVRAASAHRVYACKGAISQVMERRERSLDHLGLSARSGSTLAAPVPGKVIKVSAALGKEVAEGDVLFVLESMKMEFEIKATRKGVLEKIHVSIGQQVGPSEVLASYKDEASGKEK